MNIFYSDSETDLKLQCDCCMNSAIHRCQEVFSRLTAVCCMLLPYSPTVHPSTIRGTSVGPPVAVNSNICEYLWFFNITFVWIIWVHYGTDYLSGQERVFAS